MIPKGYKRPLVIRAVDISKIFPGVGGFALSPARIKSYSDKALINDETMQRLSKFMNTSASDLVKIVRERGIIAVPPTTEDKGNFILRHELAHTLRDFKKKQLLPYNSFPGHLLEESAVNVGALRRIGGTLTPKSFAIIVGTTAGTRQAVINNPIQAVAIAGGAAYGVNKLEKKADFWEDRKGDLEYGKYLANHKLKVFQTGRKLGVPTGTLIIHDWTKLLPHIWKPYREVNHATQGKKWGQIPDNPELYERFRKAVTEHYIRSPHHWNKFQLPLERIPLKYKLEGVADWYSSGRDKKPKFETWYKRHEGTLPLDQETKNYIRTKLR